MREILFRGKRTDNGEWVYGNYQHTDCYVKCNDYMGQNKMDYTVIPETVGQYTGLTDKNGTKIFEGDIVKCTDKTNGYDFTAVVLFGNPNAQYNWGFQLKQISGEKANVDILLWVEMEESGAFIEVIDNIHDKKIIK